MEIHIDRPILNRKTPEENIALIDKWISETTDKLNILISDVNKERRDNNGSSN